jgi:hypothetical protein
MARTLQGKFRPKNPDKYKGNPGEIYYRSSWELDFMQYCDTTSAIIWWMSEERCVWYTNPIDKKKHRYFPDFIVCYNRSDGVEVTEMVEIKPQKHVDGPNPNPKRRTKSWVTFAYSQRRMSGTGVGLLSGPQRNVPNRGPRGMLDEERTSGTRLSRCPLPKRRSVA